MRTLLLVSLLLLAAAWFQQRRTEALRSANPQVADLRVYSTGLGLPPPLALKPAGLGAIRCGLVTTSAKPIEQVLVAAAIDAHGEVTRTARFDLRGQWQAVVDLEAFCAEARPGTVLAFAVRGSVQPAGENRKARAEALDRLFAELGAECRPQRQLSASWAFACAKDRRGFTRLGEAFSKRAGVVLALPLGGAGPVGMPPGGWRVIDEAPGKVAALLAANGAPVRHAVRMKNGSLDAAQLVPDGAPWTLPELQLGSAARFTASLGLSTNASRTDASAVVELLVDGERIARRELRVASDAGTWRPWSVSLGAFAERKVELELRVHSTRLAPDARVMVGAPLLSQE